MRIHGAQLRRGSATVAWALGAGILLAIAVVVIGWLIEPEPTEFRKRHRNVDVTDLVTPGELTSEERSRATASPDGSAITLEDGAWVQVADEEGRLAQQYSAERIDPMPDGWLEMARPRAMMFFGDGRVLTMRGEHGLLNVPQQAISSGTLDGDVVIRLFVPRDGQPIDITRSDPEVIVRTQEAAFDNELGEIRCVKAIRIDSKDATFEGEGLTILLGTTGETIERLVVERATAPVRITFGAAPTAADEASDEQEAQALEEDGSLVAASDDGDAVSSFYRLQLEENVRVRVYDTLTSSTPDSTIQGETLTALFSLEGDALEQSVAYVPSETTAPMSRHTFLSAATLAQAADEEASPSGQRIEIEYDGRLVMVPAESSERPANPEDVVLQVEGGSQPVRLTDARSEATATCDFLSYQSAGDLAELRGSATRPLEVDSPSLQLRGERFWIARADGLGGLTGAGSMRISGRSESASEVAVGWGGEVDLRFVPGTESLDQATFKNDVQVDGEDFALDAAMLDVRFAQGPEGDSETIKHIRADGTAAQPVRAQRKGEQGLLIAERIDLALMQDSAGRTVPENMRAVGRVQAQDAQQTLFAKALDVGFVMNAQTRASDSGAIEIDRVVASDGVQVLLADGARVWAETLRGSGVRRQITLASEDDSVVIVRGNVVTDYLREVRFDDISQTAQAEGPGRFRFFDEPIAMSARGQADPPSLANMRPSMEATWTQQMRYDNVANEGGGSLDLRGDVVVRNRPEAREENDLDAQELRLDFVERAQVSHLDAEGNPAGEDQRMAFSGSRDLRMLIAKGSARLETRSWLEASREGEPDLFQISGDEVRYNAQTGEGGVAGAGVLLVNRVGSQPSTQMPGAVGISLGGDGTTRFSWQKNMRMQRKVGSRYVVTMTERVEILHAGVQDGDTMTLSADKLDVTIDRPLTDADVSSDGGLDLGGQAQIVRVTASGKVFVRTSDHDVECEVFDYDASNQIAELSAREGRYVTIMGRESVAPVRAKTIRWDMQTGRMQITGVRGSAGG